MRKELLLQLIGKMDYEAGLAGEAISSGSEEAANALGTERIWIWKEGFEKCFIDHPIIGIGVSNVHLVRIKFQPLTIEQIYDIHNYYLDVLYSRGIIGFVSYIALLLCILIGSFKLLKRDGLRENGMRLGIIIGIITITIIRIPL